MAFFTYPVDSQWLVVEADTSLESKQLAKSKGVDLSSISCILRTPEPVLCEIEARIPMTIVYQDGGMERVEFHD